MSYSRAKGLNAYGSQSAGAASDKADAAQTNMMTFGVTFCI